jgi:hypothetical protein
MSVIINASTTSGLVMTSDLSGNLQFQNNGVNLPMGGVAPAFSAYAPSNQTGLAANTYTKITLSTETFDTNNNFDSTTNYRFTPTVAGYYLIIGTVTGTNVNNYASAAVIYRNGAQYAWGTSVGTTNTYANAVATTIMYLNGSTDYVELYFYNGTGVTTNTIGGAVYTYLNGCLVRGA